VTGLWRTGAELDGLLGEPEDGGFPGVDNPGGIAHDDIGYLVAGTFLSPNYQSATPGQLGSFERDQDGAPVVKGYDEVPFLLALPAGLESYEDVPVLVFQHGLGEAKTAVLALANTMAARGFASISIDIPFHGGRYPDGRDMRHNYGGGEGPDGLTDATGILPAASFFNLLGDPAAGVAPLDPRVQGDSFRQAAIDVIMLARLVTDGDLGAIGEEEPALAGLGFRADRVVYASESFGGFIGVLALAFEPRYQAGFLTVAGGGLLSDLLENSPTYAGFFMPVLNGAFDVAPSDVEPNYAPAHSHWAYLTLGLLLGQADPLSYAGMLPDKGVHVILPSAFSDESVPNQSSEALAVALGLSWAAAPGAVSGPRYVSAADLPVAELPLSGNREVKGAPLTAGTFQLDPASHGMLTRGRGQRRFEPGFPPFDGLAEPLEFENPILALQGYLAGFATSYLADGIPTLGAE
jgi:hypothetical protein